MTILRFVVSLFSPSFAFPQICGTQTNYGCLLNTAIIFTCLLEQHGMFGFNWESWCQMNENSGQLFKYSMEWFVHLHTAKPIKDLMKNTYYIYRICSEISLVATIGLTDHTS